MNFNAIDLSAYGLIVTHSNIPDFRQEYDSQLIKDISYAFVPKRPPKVIRLEVAVLAADRATLDGYLDSIKFVVVSEVAYALKLDTITDRYWNAKKTAFEGGYKAAGLWEGIMVFQADDPMAYANIAVGVGELGNDHVVNEEEEMIIETPGGTGYINPVYTLTSEENHGTVTIWLTNLTTDEALSWRGILNAGYKLEIDVANWRVRRDWGGGDGYQEHMANVTGKFPRLAPSVANSIKVWRLYEAGPAGNLNIKYRNRYL